MTLKEKRIVKLYGKPPFVALTRISFYIFSSISNAREILMYPIINEIFSSNEIWSKLCKISCLYRDI